jgi:ubiquinone/menaquinone biosynthesis C-methylase UbiE
MNETTNRLKDLWTESSSYRQCYQSDDEIETTLRLLDLAGACGLVDVGCGNGAFAVAAARRWPACRVWAFDALESAVAECRARAKDLSESNLVADVAWAHALPLADASADRALCRSVLHHAGEPMAVCAEIARVLKPGGRLVLQAPCSFWEPAFAQILSGIMMLLDDTHRRYYYRPAEVVAGLEQVGFRVAEPQCWTYSFPFLGDREADFVRQHGADERLRLRPLDSGKWSIENYWVRVVATRSGG